MSLRLASKQEREVGYPPDWGHHSLVDGFACCSDGGGGLGVRGKFTDTEKALLEGTGEDPD